MTRTALRSIVLVRRSNTRTAHVLESSGTIYSYSIRRIIGVCLRERVKKITDYTDGILGHLFGS